MAVMSKNVIPTLSTMSSNSFLKTTAYIFFWSMAFTNLDPNPTSLKQTGPLISIDNLKLAASEVHKDGRIISFSDQKKTQISVSKEFDLNMLQGTGNWQINVCLAIYGDVAAIEFSNRFQKSCAQNGYEIEPFIIIVSFEYLLEKLKPAILSLFFQQMLILTRKFSKDNEDLSGYKWAEKRPFPTDATSQISEESAQRILMKLNQTCYSCREQIKRKMFFGERRFGILENCECMICYGCIRKADRNPNGVVKGPIDCPVCSTKSDNVASSTRWVEGKSKVEFFEEYFKNTKDWTLYPTTKDAMWPRSPSVSPTRKDVTGTGIPSTVKDKWTGNHPICKEDIWNKGFFPISVV